jgi:hypothetical protein
MNLRSNALALSIFSDRMLRIGSYLPFAVVIAFALLSVYSQAFHGFASSEVSVPSLSALQNQRTFLINKGLVRGLNVDFIIFEAFIWLASIVGLLRLLTGLFSAQVLNSCRGKLEAYGKQGRSPAGFIAFFSLGVPFAIVGSLNFEFASHSNQVLSIIEYSPRSFLCLATFIFCGCVIFLVEGLLLFTWVIFLSE